LDAIAHEAELARAIERLHAADIHVSLFLDPEPRQIEQAARLGADAVELHTGRYALASRRQRHEELVALTAAGKQVVELGMDLHAGHGLNYHNVIPVAQIPQMRELNIGHAIVSRAVYVGLAQAVREMKQLLR
jgi:pyridoxine 5-phosphate synthase